MMTPDTSIYTDLASFTSLRAQAQSNPDEAIDQVAAQFESIFVQMMMKSMRDASEPLESGLMASNQLESYEQMFDQQLSLDLSSGGGLGLAEIIATQLGGGRSTLEAGGENQHPTEIGPYWQSASTANTSPAEASLTVVSPVVVSDRPVSVRESEQSIVDIDQKVESKLSNMFDVVESKLRSWFPESPQEFIKDLWDLAEKAAESLGVNPKVILAQAALETGWGKHVIQNPDGSSSFNLFGIKAGNDWQGAEARVQTLEYEDGVASKQTASFRSYESLADAFEDYVSFLTQSPRYEQALKGAADAQQYVQGLQQGGYATDPKYAEKILSILSRDEFDTSVNELKAAEGVSTI